MNVIHFLGVVCVGMLVRCCLLLILFRKFYINCIGKPLFLAMVHIVFPSCCFATSVMGVDNNLCIQKIYAASLCCSG